MYIYNYTALWCSISKLFMCVCVCECVLVICYSCVQWREAGKMTWRE